jgi:hypothetical protein
MLVLNVKTACFFSALLALSCCQVPPSSVARFCDRSDYESFINRTLGLEYVDIDLAGRRLRGADVSDHVELVEAEQYFGMIEPLPLLIPKLKLNYPSRYAIRVTHGNISLLFRPIGSSSDEFMGDVYRTLPAGGASHVLTYKYSRRNGVYEIVSKSFARGRQYQQVLHQCGGAKLFRQE